MKLKKLLPLIGVALFIYILFKLNLSNIIKEISNADLKLLSGAVVFTFLFMVTQTLKWFAIARAQKIRVPFVKSFVINTKGFFYSFITPSNIGGLMRAEYLREYNENSLGKGVSNFALDKVFDLCSLIFLVIVFSFMLRKFFGVDYLYYAIILLFVLLIGLFVFAEKGRSKKILKGFFRFIPNRIKEKAKISFYSFYKDMPEKKYFFLFFVLNILNWVMLITGVYFVGLSLGINLPYFYFLAILPITTLIGHLPITINGLGTREAAMIALFGLLNIEATKIVSMSIIQLIIGGILPSVFGGLIIFGSKEKI